MWSYNATTRIRGSSLGTKAMIAKIHVGQKWWSPNLGGGGPCTLVLLWTCLWKRVSVAPQEVAQSTIIHALKGIVLWVTHVARNCWQSWWGGSLSSSSRSTDSATTVVLDWGSSSRALRTDLSFVTISAQSFCMPWKEGMCWYCSNTRWALEYVLQCNIRKIWHFLLKGWTNS